MPWLYPAEIFPLEIRAKGNAWGVVGWSIGNGWLVCLSILLPLQGCFAPFDNHVVLENLLLNLTNLTEGLLCPVMFAALNEKTLYIFGICNVITIPMVWALYPETNQRTLEEMNLVFASDSIWNWEAEKNFALLKEQNPQLVQAARGRRVVDEENPKSGLSVARLDTAGHTHRSIELTEFEKKEVACVKA